MSDRMIYSVKLNFKEGLMTKEEKKTIKAENKERNRELKEFLKKPENKDLRSLKRMDALIEVGTVASSLEINAKYNEAYEFEKDRLAKGDITQEEWENNVKELKAMHEKALKKNRRKCRIRQIGSAVFLGLAGGTITGVTSGLTNEIINASMEEAKSTSKNKTKAQQDEIIKLMGSVKNSLYLIKKS